jgi:hypothetical protein
MKPAFSAEPGHPRLPLFAFGQLLSGQPLAWIFSGARPVEAQVRGRLWRLPSGAVLISLDPAAGWVLGEIYPQPPAQAMRLLPSLLSSLGISPGFEQVRARVDTRAPLVQVWAAPAHQLARMGAHQLKSGNWRRIAPR